MTEENLNPQEPGPASEEPAGPAEDAGTPEFAAAGGEENHEGVASEPSPSPTDGKRIAPPPAPTAPQPPVTQGEPGQRRITRHTTTSTTRTDTTTDETVVETIAVAPPVYAAPSGEHPRPVG